ncbi:N-acyl-D-amino-acid deacylase family protein [Fictibacillus sp. S7]|uniref:N-acyl-D-amino-acid deacylase family protein n=1 Tax=Fictibacillus sp. S7 TaxID=2212476 RepID=UPI001010F21F|nr:D-aminoacylase [Fictibacillus sp. S7]RXY98925.1 D-aminoacylase [Fictibacillus sp. S7]
MLDLVIQNGRIADGSGNPWFFGSVGIKDGIIVEVGTVNSESRETIDAKRNIISPGFIDGHSHSDLLVLNRPMMDIKLQQGVTTEVVGNCGLAPAPFVPKYGALLKEYIQPVVGETQWEWPWHSVSDYIRELDRTGISENVSTYVAHGALRIAVMGFAGRPADKQELNMMKEMLNEGMKAGAIGLSIGLLYSPGRYASKEELAVLCQVLPKYNGILSTHIRGEGNNLIPSIKEVIWIAEKAGIPLHVSHLKAAGRLNWGKVLEAMELLEEASARGLDVTCDVYPYDAGSTSLTTLLPPWSPEGGIPACLDRIREPATRRRMIEELGEEQEEWDNLVVSTGWDNVVVSSLSCHKEWEGKSLEAISTEIGKSPAEAALDLLLEEGGMVSIIYYHMSNEDVEQVVKWDRSLVISDSLGCETGKPHPRSFGTFPRLFSKNVREDKSLSLEQAIRKVTSFPAQRFSLGKRGLIVPGYHADLTIFDEKKITDTATYHDPIQQPEGISHVIVNGILTIREKENLRQSGGKAIKAAAAKCLCQHHTKQEAAHG